MPLSLMRRRMAWCLTAPGWACLFLVVATLPTLWWFCGESFLSQNQKLHPAEILVVEGWIGLAGLRAASAEFTTNGYQYVVATGGMTSARWSDRRWSYADMAQRELVRNGIAAERIFVAPADEADSQRTQTSAMAVWRGLAAGGVRPAAVNVFTLGVHARRSRLVFAKTCGPETRVGVIGWTPPEFAATPWWRSSERARELLIETISYVFEVVSPGSERFSADAAVKNAVAKAPRGL